MAELSYPFPAVGEVHNYEYLFRADHEAGRTEGRKARPVLVVAAGNGRVVVMPITTKGEVVGSRTVPIPIDIARAMNLPRPEESSLLVDEANSFEWVGYDIRPVPGGTTSRFGRATPRFVSAAVSRFLSFGKSPVRRD